MNNSTIAPKHLTQDDLTIGKVIYVAHPFYGIDTYKVQSKPYISKYTNSLFIKTKIIFTDAIYDHETSLHDAGLLEDSYNLRRTFDTLGKAQAYVEYMLTKDSTHIHQAKHEARIAAFDEWDDL